MPGHDDGWVIANGRWYDSVRLGILCPPYASTHPRSRGALSPEPCQEISRPLKTEGAGNAGCPMHPQPRARLRSLSMRTSIHSGGTGNIRHSLARMVLRVIRDLPSDEFLLPPSPRGLDDTSNPGWAECVSTQLDINNGCQDHTTSPSATLPLVSRAFLDRSRISSPCDLMRTRHRRVHRIPHLRS